MTQTLTEIHRDAARTIYVHDIKRDQFEHCDKVKALTAVGMSAAEIGTQIGLSSRQVMRLRSAPPPPDQLKFPAPHQISDERAAELEQAADAAVDLACRLRDENPAIVWEALSRLDRRLLQELAVVLLAALPIDATMSELFGWICNLPIARSEATA